MVFTSPNYENSLFSKNKLFFLAKKVNGPLVFADDDQQRSRPGRLAKHPVGVLLSPAGYLTPPVDSVTDGRTN